MSIKTKDIDYGLLDELLTTHQWDKAEQETASLMLKLVGKTYWWDIEPHDLILFPCEALCKINVLWLTSSNGRFGFSVQKEIWQYLGCEFNYESEKQLGDRLGWRKQGAWLSTKELIFDLSAPTGHLPGWGLNIFWLGLQVADAFLERVCSCEFSDFSTNNLDRNLLLKV